MFLTVFDLSERYAVHRTTVRRWLRSGQLASIRLPGGYRVPREALDAFERSRLSKKHH
jgi:excisionase family DNA binding protein